MRHVILLVGAEGSTPDLRLYRAERKEQVRDLTAHLSAPLSTPQYSRVPLSCYAERDAHRAKGFARGDAEISTPEIRARYPGDLGSAIGFTPLATGAV